MGKIIQKERLPAGISTLNGTGYLGRKGRGGGEKNKYITKDETYDHTNCQTL